MSGPLNILVADDHALIREGLRMVLRGFDENVVCHDAFDGASVERMLAQHPEIELVLLDRHLPDCDGLDLLARLVSQRAGLPIVMLSAELDHETVTRAIDLGAAGFIPKTSVTTLLVSALKLVMAGGVYIPAEALRGGRAARTAQPAQPPTAQSGPTADLARATPGALNPEPSKATVSPADIGLTERQTEVLALLMEGQSNKQISRVLDMAEATVKVHVRSILRSLNANSRTEAVVTASRMGLTIPLRPQPASGP